MARRVIEDVNVGGALGDWASVPSGLYKGVPSANSTTIRCHLCGNPFDGLIYDRSTDTFRHRVPCRVVPLQR